MRNPLLEFYSDYLISSFALATATGLSRLLDNAFSHDQITRFLSGSDYTSRDLWGLVKPAVRAIEADDAARVFDDTIEEKPHSDENEIIAWHFGHCQGRTVKGGEPPQLPVPRRRRQRAGGIRDRPQGLAVLRGGNQEAQAPKLRHQKRASAADAAGVPAKRTAKGGGITESGVRAS